jgi:hypothetical protein
MVTKFHNGNDGPAMRRRRHSGRGLVIALACAAGLLVFRGEAGQAADNDLQVVAQLQPDGGPFYRLKVELWYKGERQDFDIVVGCSVPAYHSRKVTWYVMVPEVFGRKMSDGKALVVRAPRACNGETTANSRVQPDLLPLVAVFDDAETLSFGTAYLSEDAYQNPLSVLKFGGATIEAATRADFDEFRHTQKNAVTRSTFWSHAPVDVRQEMGLPPSAAPFGNTCEYYLRFRLPDELRAVAGLHWPSGKPDYWFAKTPDEESYLARLINESMHLRSDGLEDRPDRPQHIGWGDADTGFPTRTGGGRVSMTRGRKFAGAYYPAGSDDRADKWPADPEEKARYFAAHETFDFADIDFRGGRTRGFAYCTTWVNFSQAALSSKLTVARVDGEPIWHSSSLPLSTNLPKYVFERNEFVFLHFNVALGPSRGDVW